MVDHWTEFSGPEGQSGAYISVTDDGRAYGEVGIYPGTEIRPGLIDEYGYRGGPYGGTALEVAHQINRDYWTVPGITKTCAEAVAFANRGGASG